MRNAAEILSMTAEEFLSGQVILIDKPYRWTSFQVVNKLKYLLKYHFGLKKFKIGHAGTLDPLATGLLIICIGKHTKRIGEFQAQEKEYTGTFRFGATTPCFDLEKPIDTTYPFEHINNEILQDAARHFTCSFEQVPPTFSAVWVNGKRAFQYARNDEKVNLEPKTITISAFEWTKLELPDADFRVACSKGTYIRALARDIGVYVNSGAHLTALRRTRIGNFSVEDALSIQDWEMAYEHFKQKKAR